MTTKEEIKKASKLNPKKDKLVIEEDTEENVEKNTKKVTKKDLKDVKDVKKSESDTEEKPKKSTKKKVTISDSEDEKDTKDTKETKSKSILKKSSTKEKAKPREKGVNKQRMKNELAVKLLLDEAIKHGDEAIIKNEVGILLPADSDYYVRKFIIKSHLSDFNMYVKELGSIPKQGAWDAVKNDASELKRIQKATIEINNEIDKYNAYNLHLLENSKNSEIFEWEEWPEHKDSAACKKFFETYTKTDIEEVKETKKKTAAKNRKDAKNDEFPINHKTKSRVTKYDNAYSYMFRIIKAHAKDSVLEGLKDEVSAQVANNSIYKKKRAAKGTKQTKKKDSKADGSEEESEGEESTEEDKSSNEEEDDEVDNDEDEDEKDENEPKEKDDVVNDEEEDDDDEDEDDEVDEKPKKKTSKKN